MNVSKLMVLVVALLLAQTAVAQGPCGPMMQGRGPGKGRMLGLDLTDEQRSKVDNLRLTHLKEIEPLRADLERQRSALALEITADKYNESKVKGIQNEISKIQNEIAMKRIGHQREIRALLTPEQQKAFDTRMLERRGGPGFGNLGQGRGQGHGQRGMHRENCRGCWN